jgi:hypothetical protein
VCVSRNSTLSNSELFISHVFGFRCLLVCGKREMLYLVLKILPLEVAL